MNTISIIMPVVGAVGVLVIIVVLLIVRSLAAKERMKCIDAESFSRFVEEISRENTQIRKDLQTVKEKVEAIDRMMKDI